MKRAVAAVFVTSGFLLAGAAQAAQPIPRGVVFAHIQARLNCNKVQNPAQRKACIERVCAAAPAPQKKACADGTGAYAARPAPKPVVQKPKPAPKPVVQKPKPAPKPVVGKPKQPPKPSVAQLNQKRAQLSKLRSEVVSLCRKIYEGKAEADCIRGLFPAAPGTPLKKPAN